MSDESIDVKFGAQTGELEAGVEKAKDSLGEIGGAAEGLIGSLGELAAAFGAAFAVDKIEEFAKEISGIGVTLQNMSAQTGLSTGQVEDFQNTIKVLGGSVEGAGMSLMRLERNIANASSNAAGPAADAFHRLGVSQADLQKGDVTEIMTKMSAAMADSADGANKLGAMMQVAGRGGMQLITMLDQGPEGIQRIHDAIDSTGPSLDKYAAQFQQSAQGIQLVDTAHEKMGATIYSVLEPALDGAAVGMKDLYASIANNTAAGAPFNELLKIMGDIITGITATVITLATAFEGLMDMIGTFAKAAVDLMDGAAEAIGDAWKNLTTGIGDALSGNASGAIKSFSKIADESATDFSTAWTKAQADIEQGFEKSGAAGNQWVKTMKDMMDVSNGEKSAGTGIGGGSKGTGQIAAPAPPKGTADKEVTQDSSKDRELYASNYEAKKSNDELMVASGKMSHSEELSDLQAALTHQQALTDASFDNDAAQYEKDEIGYSDLMTQKAIADNKFADKHNKLTEESLKEDDKAWKSAADTVSKSLDTMVNGVLQGTQTMWQMFGKMLGNLVLSMADAVVKMGVTWAAGQLKNLVSTQTTTAQQTASVTAGQTAQTAAVTAGLTAQTSAKAAAATTAATTQAAASEGAVMKDAGTAAAGAYASVAQIPYVGWLLAPAAAAGAFAATAAYGSFDVGTDYVPQDMMAMVHKGERITPASMNTDNKGAKAYAPSTDEGASGSDTHVHFHVNAMDSGDVQGFFSKHGPTIAKTVSAQMRAGNLRPTGAH